MGTFETSLINKTLLAAKDKPEIIDFFLKDAMNCYIEESHDIYQGDLKVYYSDHQGFNI